MNYPPIRKNIPMVLKPSPPSKYKYSTIALFLILVSISILGVLLSSRSKEMFAVMEKFGDQQSYTEQNFNSATLNLLSTPPDASLIPPMQSRETNWYNNNELKSSPFPPASNDNNKNSNNGNSKSKGSIGKLLANLFV